MTQSIAPKQPYYLSGYTGHCPEIKSRYGSSFSALSHKILLDPLVRHSHKLVLSDTNVEDYKLNKKEETCYRVHEKKPPIEQDIDDFEYRDKFKFPIAAGYTGHLPQTDDVVGTSRTLKAEETLPCLKERLKNEHKTRKEIENINDLRYGRKEIKTIAEKELLKNEFTLPLIEVRPEYTSIIRNVFQDEKPKPKPPATLKLPYFLDNEDEEKYFVTGYTGHVPFGFAKFGETHQAATNHALRDFTFKFNRMKSTEWAPAGTLREEPAHIFTPHKIYSEKHGIIPNYTGFVPGIRFRVGKTYGEMTRDIKKWQRGDLSN